MPTCGLCHWKAALQVITPDVNRTIIVDTDFDNLAVARSNRDNPVNESMNIADPRKYAVFISYRHARQQRGWILPGSCSAKVMEV